MRLFVASRLCSANRQAISTRMTEVVDRSQGILRPVASGSEHLTHLFLGDRDQALPEILEALEAIQQLPGFRIRVGGARVFIGRGRPRLVCLSVLEGEEEVVALSERIRSGLEVLFPDLVGYRLKTPHVTLARFSRRSRRADGRRVEDMLAAGGLGAWQAEDSVQRVKIIRSELTPAGARYETLGSVSLKQPVD